MASSIFQILLITQESPQEQNLKLQMVLNFSTDNFKCKVWLGISSGTELDTLQIVCELPHRLV